ncbi:MULTISPECIES: acylphosphatase [Pedobacter]|uniref:Acylphosphatase n=1 Tax=Pedobacter heparinus (strain ATCC 13125 / DSM 2366 / CIP 104194 / JCM 7457 / NBRC 12017 / NCIMB 9290 / NRRL B-14731 / HIM 762-3) TaxID=485917 RepID=C6XV26_PEDHD|nr:MULTISPECIES: acylphosphatase [Pedobacter]ACU06034.1 acylphosphatase [Pedobacter heparinus DSM 2366]MBB5438794.1 acylphosphatase [Pedobacter sp. AK017]
MKKIHLNIKITGKVQGVTFRETTKYVADQSGIKGFVRNEPDGSVYIEAEGEQWELDSFLEWCNDGPDRAKVENCAVEMAEPKHFTDFVILKK